jgi:SAM-dependent methyltransferase
VLREGLGWPEWFGRFSGLSRRLRADVRSKSMPILFALDEPQYHQVVIGEVNRFRGAVLAVDESPVLGLRVHRRSEFIVECRVDKACPELAFLSVPNAATSRFELDMLVIDGEPYALSGVDASGQSTVLFEFDPAEAASLALRELTDRLGALPVPSGEIVAVTQGGDNTQSYRNSTISSFMTSRTLLRNAGVEVESIQSVLDIGCGTGRLLLGWHNSGGVRRTVGVDTNAELIAWNNRNLRDVAEWYEVTALPPLSLESEAFDLVIVASVFTHLPLAWQRAWVAEIVRLLRPNGVVLLTLNGAIYVKTILDGPGRDLFARAGYAEGLGGQPGANSFSTYHSEGFATELVRPLVPLAMYPSGRSLSRPPSWFPMGAWQDIYVLRKPALL